MADTQTATPEDTNKAISIQGVSVTITQPYAAGHVVTDAEAKALNQVRAENIGNNLRKRIKELSEAEGADPKQVAKAAQKLVTQYDAEYQFTLASVGGGGSSKLSPIEKEARRIARELVNNKLREIGTTQKAYNEANGEDALKIKIAEIAGKPEVVKIATANIAARQEPKVGVTI